jgi:hypothetical protein
VKNARDFDSFSEGGPKVTPGLIPE